MFLVNIKIVCGILADNALKQNIRQCSYFDSYIIRHSGQQEGHTVHEEYRNYQSNDFGLLVKRIDSLLNACRPHRTQEDIRRKTNDHSRDVNKDQAFKAKDLAIKVKDFSPQHSKSTGWTKHTVGFFSAPGCDFSAWCFFRGDFFLNSIIETELKDYRRSPANKQLIYLP